MSTIFKVFPGSTRIPTFQEVLNLSTLRLREFLSEFGIPAAPSVQAFLYRKEPNPKDPDVELQIRQPLDLGSPLLWPEDGLAWFTVPPVDGGTDAYFKQFSDWDRRFWAARLQEEDEVRRRRELVEPCLVHGYYWVFRRSASQPAIIRVAYGLIAASVAQLTQGFIDSIDDTASEGKQLPTTAAEFLSWYYRPNQAIDLETKQRVEKNIALLVRELAGEAEDTVVFA